MNGFAGSAPMTDALMPCGPCAWQRMGRVTGRYHLHCVTCCARLVRSCRPWKQAQEAMLAIIARQPGRPSKAEVIEAIKAIDNEEKSCA